MLLVPTSLLLSFHVYLNLTGQTTCEYFSRKRADRQQPLNKKLKSVRHVRYAALTEHQTPMESVLEEGALSRLFDSEDSVLTPNYEEVAAAIAGGTEDPTRHYATVGEVGSVSSGATGSSAFVSLLCIMYPTLAGSSITVNSSSAKSCCPCGSCCGTTQTAAAAAALNSTLSSDKSLPTDVPLDSDSSALAPSVPTVQAGRRRRTCCCPPTRLPPMWQTVSSTEEE